MALFRNGQWIKTTQDVKYTVDVEGEKIERVLPAGTVGIHFVPTVPTKIRIVVAADDPSLRAGEVVDTLPNGVVIERTINKPGPDGEFHRLDPTGLVTVGTFKIATRAIEALVNREIHISQLTAVIDREEVPAGRLATMNPDWTPQP